jgi:protocatechuate 3,4-dioxygenase beta subunit
LLKRTLVMRLMGLAWRAVTLSVAFPVYTITGQISPQQSNAAGVRSTSASSNVPGAFVAGSVFDEQSGISIHGSRVYLRSTNSKQAGAYLTLTDSEGRFTIAGVDPGRYTVMASHNSYVTSEYGADRTKSGAVITLQAGQSLTGINIRLSLPGVVTGRVLDEKNNPIILASVQCMRIDSSSGRRRLAPAHGTSTNDLGEYRIFGVMPGRYVLTAAYHGTPSVVRAEQVVLSPEARAAEAEGYLPAFYVNATSAEAATPISVLAGTEAHGVDLRMSRARVVHVRGVILGSTGLPVRAGNVLLWRVDAAGRSSMGPEVGRVSPSNGTFELADVAPGSYLLGVNGSTNGVDREDAWKSIQVGDTDIDLKLLLSKPLELKGSVVVEGVSAPPDGLKVSLESTRLSGRQSIDIKAGEQFGFRSLPPDAYGVAVTSDKGDLYIKSVRLGNTDYTDSNVELAPGGGGDLVIKASGAAGEVKGTVELTEHSAAAGVTVVLIPNAPKRELNRLYKVAATDDKGTFTFSGVAPGGYLIFAWEDVETNAWRDPDFLRPIESLSQEVSVEENSHKTVTLTVIPKGTTN